MNASEHPDHHPSPGDVAPRDDGAAPPVHPLPARRLLSFGLGTLGVLVLLLIVTIVPRHNVQRELLADVAQRDSAPLVEVTTVTRAPAGSELTLPGTIQALHEGAIYARVPGYVTRWHADIGSVVHAGEVMAEIDAPELEQSVQQAQAQLAQTRAALGLARADLERWKQLAGDSAVTGQELDQKRAAYDAAVANTGAAEANVRRLVQERQYTRVTAPFTGVVTARNVDIGSLITTAGSASGSLGTGGSGGGLFRLAETDTVRTYVTVPEVYATSIAPGLEATVNVQGIPGRRFTGRVARTSRSLDPSSRTLLTEIDIANRDFALLPGMYAEARLSFPRVTPPLLLPASALVIRSRGTQVMVLDSPSRGSATPVHLRAVTVGRDYGSTVEIAAGLNEGETVVQTPNADMTEGSMVRVARDPGARAGRPAAP
jgi:membrane fusion protein (multidrug efflux system)